MLAAFRTAPVRYRTSFIALAIACVALGTSVRAADGKSPAEIDARYQRERAACESGRSGQDLATCLQEAAAARDAARRGQLDDAQANYEKNALARCDALPPEERDSCRRRVRGEGETRGSVSGGGIYREYRELTIPSAPPGNTTPDK